MSTLATGVTAPMTLAPSASAGPSPAAIEALYATGHWLYTQQRYADAESVFRALVHLAEQDERGWLGLGATHEAEGRHDVAFHLYQAAASLTDAPRCDLARARILRQRGLEQEARETLDGVARLAIRTRDHELARLVETERGRR